MKKANKGELAEDTNIGMGIIDFSKPISEKLLIQCLLDRDIRNDSILNYSHFDLDGNRSVFVQWISDHLTSRNNELLENIFDLSVNIALYKRELLFKAEEIVSGRYYELTKLAVLDWVLLNKVEIEPLKCYQLNCTAFTKTKQPLVKLQAAVNLTLHNATHLDKVATILMREHYPTAFYRLINSFDHMDDKRRELFTNLIVNNFNNRFSESVINDLESRIKEYR